MTVGVEIPDVRGLAHERESAVPFLFWPSSRLLVEALLSAPEQLLGKSVLELGCGSHGIVALAASHSGAARVVATDLNSAAVQQTLDNIARNTTGVADVGATVLDWEHPEDCTSIHAGEQFHFLLGADIVHENAMASLVVATLRRFLAPSGQAFIVNGNSYMRYGVEAFLALLHAAPDFEVNVGQVPPDMVERLNGCDHHEPGMAYEFIRLRRLATPMS